MWKGRSWQLICLNLRIFRSQIVIMLFKVKIIFLRNSKDGFDQLLNWTGQCRLGLLSSQLKFILPEFLSLKPELCCPKFLVKSPEIVSYVTWNFIMLNNILTSPLQIYCTCFVLAPVVQKVDNAIHWINPYPLDSAIRFCNTHPLDNDLSCG